MMINDDCLSWKFFYERELTTPHICKDNQLILLLFDPLETLCKRITHECRMNTVALATQRLCNDTCSGTAIGIIVRNNPNTG